MQSNSLTPLSWTQFWLHTKSYVSQHLKALSLSAVFYLFVWLNTFVSAGPAWTILIYNVQLLLLTSIEQWTYPNEEPVMEQICWQMNGSRYTIHFSSKTSKIWEKWNVKPCILIKFFDWYMNVPKNKMKEKWDNKWFSWTRNLVDFIIIHNLFYSQFRISVYCIHNFIHKSLFNLSHSIHSQSTYW